MVWEGPGINGTIHFAECKDDFSFGEEYSHRTAHVGTKPYKLQGSSLFTPRKLKGTGKKIAFLVKEME